MLFSRKTKNMSANQDTTTGNKEQKGILDGVMSGKTFGVQNIEAAYSRAGTSDHHTPGSASALGSQNQHGAAEEHQGVGSAKFVEGISDQRSEVCCPRKQDLG